MNVRDLIRVPGVKKFDPQFEGKPSGAVIIGGQEVAHTRKCVHCGGHFVSIIGSGTRRGWCLNCKGVTCGKPACDPCIPFEAKLDYFESQNAAVITKLLQKYPALKNLRSL